MVILSQGEIYKEPLFLLTSIIPCISAVYLFITTNGLKSHPYALCKAWVLYVITCAQIQSNVQSNLRLSIWKRRRILSSCWVNNDYPSKNCGSWAWLIRKYRKNRLHLETTSTLLEITKGAKFTEIKRSSRRIKQACRTWAISRSESF